MPPPLFFRLFLFSKKSRVDTALHNPPRRSHPATSTQQLPKRQKPTADLGHERLSNMCATNQPVQIYQDILRKIGGGPKLTLGQIRPLPGLSTEDFAWQRSHLSQCINVMALESQLPHRIVNVFSTFSSKYNILTILWRI